MVEQKAVGDATLGTCFTCDCEGCYLGQACACLKASVIVKSLQAAWPSKGDF